MNTFVSNIGKPESGKTFTANGAITRKSSLNHLVDFFYTMGASRNKSPKERFQSFFKAYQEHPELTLRAILHLRDIRSGMGERNYFREILVELARLAPHDAKRLIPMIPSIGRADDLFVLVGTILEQEALEFYISQLKAGNHLFFKWAPREKSSKAQIAYKLRKLLGMTPKAYRSYLSKNTEVVETPMCAKEWSSIKYMHVPSQASRIYSKAFHRHDASRYEVYLKNVAEGKEKINANAIYPFEVIKNWETANSIEQQRIIAQWDALPDYMIEASVLPIIDTSGSMSCSAGKSSVTCHDVATSLGLYVASKAKGAFKDVYMEFSSHSHLHKVQGDVITKLKSMHNIIANTDFSKAIDNILQFGIENNVPAADMPKVLLIFSDMQFDSGVSNFTIHKETMRKYLMAGYPIPKVVYWNLKSCDNVPVKAGKEGVALVSGFSPALIKNILKNIDNLTPLKIVMQTIMNPKYDIQ